MFEPFPILSDNRKLASEDFFRFSASYSGILRNSLPTAGEVDFCFDSRQLLDLLSGGIDQEEVELLFQQTMPPEAKLCLIHPLCLMLTFPIENNQHVVAVVRGADPVFLSKVREDWLLDTRDSVEREFVLLKQARVDVQTGLLNLSNLFYLLASHVSPQGLRLVLLELRSARLSLNHTFRHLRKCTTALTGFMRGNDTLHYLGQSTFALVVQSKTGAGQSEFESSLVAYLRREGFRRVHIGSSCSHSDNGEVVKKEQNSYLLDEAWSALRRASRRGPFSFCEYSIIASPETHPLAPPDRNLVRKLKRISSDARQFCLVQFRGDSSLVSAKSAVVPLVDRGIIIPVGEDLFVFLEGVGSNECLKWTNEIIQQLDVDQSEAGVSAGISCFPFGDFKKSDTLLNCRKALLHAAFYGSSSVEVFDAVSLNISGDICFGDGDLTRAVREYKSGLKCDNKDVNLHNSLGVALAMMDKLQPAKKSFRKALAIDRDNFMALYNLGLAEQARGRKKEALSYLEKALANFSDDESQADIQGDLELQLGILSCETGKHDAALGYLGPYFQQNRKDHRSGKVCYYLGASYHGLKNNKKAMELLQQALRFDEFDDRAMNLLGMVYLKEGEGDDIALSLCLKSIELEPGNVRHRLHLARVQLQCGMIDEAKENLRRCLRNTSCKVEAQYLLGKSYLQVGSYHRALGWFKKVLGGEKVPRELMKKAERKINDTLEKTKK